MEFLMAINSNNKNKYRYVIFEKVNNPSKEWPLWEILKIDYGFKPKIINEPLSCLNEIKKFLNLPFKTNTRLSAFNLCADIGENHYEAILDTWSVDLLRNGIIIFDGRRFEDEDFLKLIN